MNTQEVSPRISLLQQPLGPQLNEEMATYDWSRAWSEKELAAFEDVKQAIIESCSLHYPDDAKALVIETNPSIYGRGSALYQYGEDKGIKLIASMGRK